MFDRQRRDGGSRSSEDDKSTEDVPSLSTRPIGEALPSGAGMDLDPNGETGNFFVQGHQVGRYSVLRLIGKGGMGTVYKAYDPRLDRDVALKVLRHDFVTDTDSGHRMRDSLIQEAQTLARLDHPNVVTVYDSGPTADGVYIAMQLCDGQTLREWLQERRRGVRELLEVFIAAGRGLAHAHALHIVHRDFKPANVLIGEDGSVRVADFGLAFLPERPASDNSDTMTGPGESDGDRSVSAIVGTPTFMAPEQLLGRLGDHHQDQFSFCLALYAALLGRPAFPGRTFKERRRLVPRGLADAERERLQRARHLPARVRRALLRGLSVSPVDRFPSMNALLRELEERRRWPFVLSAAALVTGLGTGAAVMGMFRDDPCAAAESALGEVWEEPAQRALRSAFADHGPPGAEALFETTAEVLDRYTDTWVAGYEDACRDTWVTRQQSQQMLDARMQCLQRRRNRLDAAIGTLLEAKDPTQLEARMLAAFRLPSVEDCADVDRLQRDVAPPADPELRARIQELQRSLDQASTHADADDHQRGIAAATDVVKAARAMGEPVLLAQALELLGRLQANAAPATEAEQTLREAIVAAARAGRPSVEARAWSSLVFTLAAQSKFDEGVAVGLAAESADARADDELGRAWLLNSQGMLYGLKNEPARAQELLRESLEIKRRVLGGRHPDVAIAWSNLGNALMQGGQLDEAAEAFVRAREVFAESLGPEHRLTYGAVAGQCWVELGRERYGRAYELCARALEHFQRSPDTPSWMGKIHFRTAKALLYLGRYDEAAALTQRAHDLVAPVDPARARSFLGWMNEERARLRAQDEAQADSGQGG